MLCLVVTRDRDPSRTLVPWSMVIRLRPCIVSSTPKPPPIPSLPLPTESVSTWITPRYRIHRSARLDANPETQRFLYYCPKRRYGFDGGTRLEVGVGRRATIVRYFVDVLVVYVPELFSCGTCCCVEASCIWIVWTAGACLGWLIFGVLCIGCDSSMPGDEVRELYIVVVLGV